MLMKLKKISRSVRNIFLFLRLKNNNNCLPFSTIFLNGKITMGDWNTLGKGYWSDGHVIIGSFCSIGQNVSLIGTKHKFQYNIGNHRYLRSIGIHDDIFYDTIEIGNNVFIGRNAVVLAGLKIGDNSLIAAQSVVTKNVPKDAIVAGNPARVIGKRDVKVYL